MYRLKYAVTVAIYKYMSTQNTPTHRIFHLKPEDSMVQYKMYHSILCSVSIALETQDSSLKFDCRP